MKIRETCTCGAEIVIEHDDPVSTRQDVRNWREAHRCGHPQAWRRSAHSTTDARTDFGFGDREGSVVARG